MKTVIRISPSLLESYRLTQLGDFGKNGDSLERDVLGIREPSEAMSRGTAYHKLIEEGGDDFRVVPSIRDAFSADTPVRTSPFYRIYEPDMNRTWEFTEEAAAPALEVRRQYPSMLHEVKVQTFIDCAGFTVDMNMRFDGLVGLHLHEFKTKARAPEYTEYFDSLQWRCYMMAQPEIRSVNYHVFQLSTNNDKCTVHRFGFWRSGSEEDAVKSALHGFVSWLRLRPHLIEHLAKKAANGDK